jgi:Uncharacterized Fe-S protein
MGYIPFDRIKEQALAIGFQDCGAISCSLQPIDEYKQWIKNGYEAGMQYLESYIDVRENPALLLEEGQSILSFVVSYNIKNSENKTISTLNVAQFSLYKDYHKKIKSKLYTLISCIQDFYPDFKARAFVDSAPVLEKQIAKQCGLGFIGKNSCLISPQFGNKILLGEIVTNYTTDYNTKEQEDGCKKCQACMEACPNGAILSNRTINANLCNSYHTIENKESIPGGINLKNFVFGCDICLNACPYSDKEIDESKIMSHNADMDFLLDSFKNNYFNKSVFNRAKRFSPIGRIKYEKLIENIVATDKNEESTIQKLCLFFTNKDKDK